MILKPKLTLKLEIFKIPMEHFLNKLKSGKSGENHKVLSDRRCRTSIGRWFTRSPRPLLCVAHTTNSEGCDVTTLVKQRLPVHNATCSQGCSKDRQPEVQQAVNDGHLRSWGYRSEEKKNNLTTEVSSTSSGRLICAVAH